MPSILEMLKEMSDEGDSAAEGLLVRMKKFKFVLGCHILLKRFSMSRSISEYLQHKDIDLVSAVSGKNALRRSLSAFRNEEEEYAKFVDEAESYCQENAFSFHRFESENNENSMKCRKTTPAHFRDGSSFLHDEGLLAAAQATIDPCGNTAFKREFFLPLLDRLLNEIEKRFSAGACKILSLASVFHPTKLNEENVSKVEELGEFYALDSKMATNEFILLAKSNEISVWKTEYFDYIKEKERAEKEKVAKKPQAWLCLPKLLKVFGKNSLHNLYPNIFEVVRIIATLPVTVASCERVHSKVKIINNYLRASMSDERLESFVQISIERDMADRIELSSLVDRFKTTECRKLPL